MALVIYKYSLGQSYCTYPTAASHYLTLISPARLPINWGYVQIFEGLVGNMLNGAPPNVLLTFFHSLFPHITNAFLLA